MSNDMMELIAGYDCYTDAGELNAGGMADAPATSGFCASYALSVIASNTYYQGC